MQAQPAPALSKPGCKKRVEYSLEIFRGNSLARVADREYGLASGGAVGGKAYGAGRCAIKAVNDRILDQILQNLFERPRTGFER